MGFEGWFLLQVSFFLSKWRNIRCNRLFWAMLRKVLIFGA